MKFVLWIWIFLILMGCTKELPGEGHLKIVSSGTVVGLFRNQEVYEEWMKWTTRPWKAQKDGSVRIESDGEEVRIGDPNNPYMIALGHVKVGEPKVEWLGPPMFLAYSTSPLYNYLPNDDGFSMTRIISGTATHKNIIAAEEFEMGLREDGFIVFRMKAKP